MIDPRDSSGLHDAPSGSAATYPEPYTPFLRLIGAHMASTLGQPIVVENAAGAGGTSAITRATQAGADGYTIMLGSMEHMVLRRRVLLWRRIASVPVGASAVQHIPG